MTGAEKNSLLISTDSTLAEIPDGSYDEIWEAIEERLWGDGLPVVPPTVDRVRRFVRAANRAPDEVIGVLPLRAGKATVEVIAANAVMAGCRPEYMPVVIAAVKAATMPQVNLTALQTTTHPAGALIIVNGPIRNQLGMNAGAGAFGPGNRANATIGRALRLVMLNVGGARPGAGDYATQGQPGKYTYCVPENEEANPWGSLAQARGFGQQQNTVTVAPAESPHNINEHVGETAPYILENIAATIANPGANNPHTMIIPEMWLFLCPEHAETIHRGGFDRTSVQRFLYEHARLRLAQYQRGPMWGMHDWPIWMQGTNPDAQLPIVIEPDRFNIVVLGGAGKHSSWAPTNGGGRSATIAIE